MNIICSRLIPEWSVTVPLSDFIVHRSAEKILLYLLSEFKVIHDTAKKSSASALASNRALGDFSDLSSDGGALFEESQ